MFSLIILVLTIMDLTIAQDKTTPGFQRSTLPFNPTTTPMFIVPTSLLHTPYIPTVGTTLPVTKPTKATTTRAMPVVQVQGNLTGSHICPRSAIRKNWNWKDLTFPCNRKEHVLCYTCPACRFLNLTHCIHELQGECTAKIYQYDPITVSVQQCCDGYEQMGTLCLESVECQDNNGGCPHICRSNKQAGRHCECFQGFQINGSRCSDFNECTLKNGGCTDFCENTVGSYYCKCNGTRQLSTPFTCEDVDECKRNNGGCDHICKRRDGTHYCVCNKGFQLKDGRECEDINECDYNLCSFKCNNIIGTYVCKCPDGQLLKPDNRTCIGPGIEVTGDKPEGVPPHNEVFTSPTMIATVVVVAALLLLVTTIWIIWCYIKGTCCCQWEEKDGERRRKLKVDMNSIIVQYSNRDSKETGHVNPGYEPTTPPSYNNTVEEYDTNARMINGLHRKEEMAADIHIIPDVGQRATRSDNANQNGRNIKGGIALPGLT